MKRHTLNKKLMISCVAFAAVLIVSLSFAVGSWYWNKKMEEYGDLAYAYTRTAADLIDGDRISAYLETGEKDAYYQQIMDFLNATLEQSGMKYYYVFVPYEDDLVYVWDADIVEGSCPLGQREDYMRGGKEAVAKIYRHNPPEEISVERDETYGYIASAYSPVFDGSGQPVAVVGVDLSMPGIQKAMMHFIGMIVLCVSVVTVCSLKLFSVYIRRSVVRPIVLLDQAARQMVDNLEKDDVVQPDVHTGDEIEALASSFIEMDREVRAYIRQLSAVTAEKERIGAELGIAAQIQSDMLPSIFPAFPERPEFDIYATMAPAKEVGGDFYDFFLVDDDHLALVMADVSGKGVPAALFMMIAKLLLKNAAQTGLSPKAVLEKVNNQLYENNKAEMFVTVWLGILEISTGHMVCANAGHEYPAICRKGGAFELFKDRHGFVLAGMEGVRHREYEITLEEGDALFVYTDGVPEAMDPEEQFYGTQRMLAALNRQADSDCRTLLGNVHEDIMAFSGDAPQFDDITMLALRMRQHRMRKISVRPELDSLEEATRFFESILSENNAPQKVLTQVSVVVDELFSNLVHYSGATKVILGCEITGCTAQLRFSDNGLPYDPTQKPDPDTSAPLEEREPGGMGIFMVKKMMDSVSYAYRDGLNVLTLEKGW